MKLECQNCSFAGDESKFRDAKDIAARHTLGDTYSDRECPACGALALPSDGANELNRYIVIHEHRHGASTHEFRSKEPPSTVESDGYMDTVIAALDIDFEPELLETLSVYPLPRDEEMPIIGK